MDVVDLDNEPKGLLGEVWASRRFILATALGFAAAAALALFLVEARYEARSVLRIEGSSTGAASVSEAIGTPAFLDRVSERLGAAVREAPEPTLAERMLALLDGAPLHEGGTQEDGGLAERVSVQPGALAGEIEIRTFAGSGDGARALNAAVSAQLAEWLEEQPRATASAPEAEAGDALAEPRAAVETLRARLEAERPTDAAELDRDRLALEAAGRDIDEAVAATADRLERFQGLAADPTADVSPDGLDPALVEEIGAVRAFAASLEEVSQTLPQGSPRREIAALRLEQLRSRASERAQAAAEAEEPALEALEEQAAANRSQVAATQQAIAVRRGADVERGRLQRELAAAEERLRALESEAATAPSVAPENVAPAVSIVNESERSIAPPFGWVAGLAALAGLFVGTAGSFARALAVRRERQGAASAMVDETDAETGPSFEPSPDEPSREVRDGLASLWEAMDARRTAPEAEHVRYADLTDRNELTTADAAPVDATARPDEAFEEKEEPTSRIAPEAEPAPPPAVAAAVSAAPVAAPAPRRCLTRSLTGLAGLLARSVEGSRVSPGDRPDPTRQTGGRDGAARPQAGSGQEDHEAITAAEAASALLASMVSRALVVAVEENDGPAASLALARLLAADGQLVLLIDLSRSQAAARQAGVPSDAMGFREVAARSLGFSSVTVGDQKSTADIVAGGRRPADLPGGTAVPDALRFARRAYDHVLVDCGRLSAAEIVALADENCAILLAADGSPDTGSTDRLRELDAAGLDTALLRA